jgi:hypothetical protein
MLIILRLTHLLLFGGLAGLDTKHKSSLQGVQGPWAKDGANENTQ